MDKAIKDDIELQKAQIDLEGSKLKENQNLISSIINTGHDAREAESMAQAAMYKRMQLKVNEISSNMSSATAQANAKQLIGQLQQKEQAAMGDALNLAGISITGEGSQDNIDPSRLPKQFQKNIVPGLGVATSPKAANDMLEGRKAYLNGLEILGRIKELRQKVGVETFDSKERVEAASNQAQLAAVIKQMEVLGALDKGVDVFVNRILQQDPLGPSGSFTGGLYDRAMNVVRGDPVVTQVEEAEEYFRRKYGSALRSNMIYISPNVKKELLSKPGEERDNALAGLGKDVSEAYK